MRRHIVFSMAALVLAAFVAGTVTAQVAFTNPPCAAVTVTNNDPLCTARVTFATNPPGAWAPVVIPPGGFVVLPVPGAGVIVNGVISTGGFLYRFNPPAPAAGVNCGMFNWWIAHVVLSPAPPPPTCCFDVCADPCACTITINPSVAAPCNP